MKFQWNDTMADATRLVGMGNLRQATALIQQQLNRSGAAGAPWADREDSVDRHAAADAGRRAEDDAGRRTYADATRWSEGTRSPAGKSGTRVGELLEGIFECVGSSPTAAEGFSADRTADGAQAPSPRGNTRDAEGTFSSHEYRGKAGSRPYRLYVPSQDAPAPRALIVMLHGCTQAPDDFAAGTGMNALADRQGFAVVYPGQLQSANTSKCWNWFERGHQRRGSGEPSLLAGIVDEVRGRLDVDPWRIHLAGFSAGAAMAVVMAAEYPDVFASVAVHSGLPLGVASDIPSAMAAMRNGQSMPRAGLADRHKVDARIDLPAIIFHGDRDTTVHPRNGESIVAQFRGAAGDDAGQATVIERGQTSAGRPWTRRIVQGTTDCPLLEHWRLHGGGHQWSGGHRAGTYTDPKGPDASAEIVRFFAQNPRVG